MQLVFMALLGLTITAGAIIASSIQFGDMGDNVEDKKEVAILINESSQITDAYETFELREGESPADMTALVTKEYLNDRFVGSWAIQDGAAVAEQAEGSAISDNACIAMNKRLGLDSWETIPACGDGIPSGAGSSFCCASPAS